MPVTSRPAENRVPEPRPGPLALDFTFAFQPMLDISTGAVFAHEALVRGTDGAGAATILAKVDDSNRAAFDQAVRARAIELAASLFTDDAALLSINVMPNAIVDPVRCLRTTLRTARQCNFPMNRVMFEFTEHDRIDDVGHLRRVARHVASLGCIIAIDDFGAGFAGLGFLADFVPQVLKLDRALVREIEGDRTRQAIVRGVLLTARDMGITVVAEGVETSAEVEVLAGMGITIFQGYFFARPAFARLAEVASAMPAAAAPAAA